MVVSNRSLLFQGSIFRGHVSFREGILLYVGDNVTQLEGEYNEPILRIPLNQPGVIECHTVGVLNVAQVRYLRVVLKYGIFFLSTYN